MVKEYLKQNKKDLFIIIILMLAITAMGLFVSINLGFKEVFTEVGGSSSEKFSVVADGQDLFWIITYTYTLGALGLALFGYLLYFYIKPFIKKQLQQTMLIGNNPVNYLLVHVGIVIGIAILEVITIYLSDIVILFQEVGQTLEIIKIVFSRIALPLWILSMPITILNGKILNDTEPRKRIIYIILSYSIFWIVTSLLSFIPYIQQMFMVYSEETITNGAILHSSRITALSLLIDFIGIFVFVLSFNSFKKNYEIIV